MFKFLKALKQEVKTEYGDYGVGIFNICITIATLFVLFILFLFSNGSVPTNHVGISYNSLTGSVSQNVLKPGFRLKIPFFESVHVISTEVQETTLSKVTAQVKTGQFIDVDANIKWRVTPETAYTIYTNYKELSRIKDSVIQPISQRAIEEVTTRYTLDEIMGAKRAEVNTEIEKALRATFERESITLHSYVSVDMDAGDAYENALANESVKRKEAEAAQHEITKAKALGEAEVANVKAQTAKIEEEAKQKQIQAEAEAKANATLSASITDNLLRLKEQEARLKHGWVEVVGSGVNINR